jgi:hypothetical protein
VGVIFRITEQALRVFEDIWTGEWGNQRRIWEAVETSVEHDLD